VRNGVEYFSSYPLLSVLNTLKLSSSFNNKHTTPHTAFIKNVDPLWYNLPIHLPPIYLSTLLTLITMADGEDSQMHDNVSLSSTPSTPPATNNHAAVASPPNSQQQQQQQQQLPHFTTMLTPLQQQQLPGQPIWAGKRAVEEAENAKERCVDRSWSLRRLPSSWRGRRF
jgi:hypothetical protein